MFDNCRDFDYLLAILGIAAQMTAILAWLDQPTTLEGFVAFAIAGGLVVVCLTFAFGEGCTLIILLAAATLTWAASQGTALAYWQAGGFWLGWYSVVSIIAAVTRRARLRRWRKVRAAITAYRDLFKQRGLDFDYVMAETGLRLANHGWRRRCLGLDED